MRVATTSVMRLIKTALAITAVATAVIVIAGLFGLIGPRTVSLMALCGAAIGIVIAIALLAMVDPKLRHTR